MSTSYTHKPAPATYARMTRLQYFRTRSTHTHTQNHGKVYFIPGRPRVPLMWQTAWDLLGFSNEIGHYQHVAAAYLYGRYTRQLFTPNFSDKLEWSFLLSLLYQSQTGASSYLLTG